MKASLITISLLFFGHVHCQVASTVPCTGFYEPFNWARSTDSRSEAMGLTATTTTNNINTSYYNPAGVGSLEGIQGSVTSATPYYSLPDARFLYTAVGGKIKDYLKVQFSRFAYRGNYDFVSFGSTIEPEEVMTAYTLGVGSEPIKGLYIGGNLKLIEAGLIKDERAYTIMGDLGVMKKFELAKEEGHHTVNLGVSVMNFTGNRLNYSALGVSDSLDYPVIGSAGFSYKYASVNRQVFETLDLVGATVQADYVNQLNLDLRHGYRFGVELALMEMVYLRGGYYYLATCDFGFPEFNRDNIQSLTYGVGLAVPMKVWTKLPLTLNVDFANIPQPSYIHSVQQEDRFTSLNARLTWELN